VCRGTQVCRESGNSVPWQNVGSQKFSKGSFNEVANSHRKPFIFYISAAAHFYRYIRYEKTFQSFANLKFGWNFLCK